MKTASNLLANWTVRYSVLYFFCFFVEGIILASIGPSIPLKAKEAHLAETSYSIVFTCRGIGFISGAFIANYIKKLFGTHKAIAFSLTMVCFMCLLNNSETGVFKNSIQWWIIGVNHSVITILAQVEIMSINTTNASSWLQSLHFGFGFGASTSPVLLSIFGTNILIIYGIMAFILSALIFREKSSNEIAQTNQQLTTQTLNIDSKDEQTVNKLCKLIGVFLLIYVGAESNYGGWIPTYATLEGVTSQQNAGLSTSLFWIAMTFGRLLAIPIAAKYPLYKHLKALVYFGVAVSISCLVLLMLEYKGLLVFLGSLAFGFACSAVYPLGISMPVAFGYKLSASNTALMTLIGAGGEAIIPLSAGYLMKLFGPSMLYVTTFLFQLVMLVLYLQIMKYKPSTERQGDLSERKLLDKLNSR